MVNDGCLSRTHSAATPPVSASGTALNTSKASRAEPSALNSNRKIRKKQPGTMIAARYFAFDRRLDIALMTCRVKPHALHVPLFRKNPGVSPSVAVIGCTC